MIIQTILTLGLLLCIVYAFLQRSKSRLVSNAILLVASVGIYFVVFPDQSNVIARFVGVGRGADLILYCWVVISLIISISLQIKLLSIYQIVTVLTREIAILNAKSPSGSDIRKLPR